MCSSAIMRLMSINIMDDDRTGWRQLVRRCIRTICNCCLWRQPSWNRHQRPFAREMVSTECSTLALKRTFSLTLNYVLWRWWRCVYVAHNVRRALADHHKWQLLANYLLANSSWEVLSNWLEVIGRGATCQVPSGQTWLWCYYALSTCIINSNK